MAWANLVEAEMKKMAKIFENLEPPMAEEIVPRLGGEFNPSDPIYAGWSREESSSQSGNQSAEPPGLISFTDFSSHWKIFC